MAAVTKEGFWRGLWRGVAITVVGGLILAGILAAIGWAFGQVRTIGGALTYPITAVAHWVSQTIPVSRGQCIVWFGVGLALGVGFFLIRHALTNIEIVAGNFVPTADEELVLKYMAEHGGCIFDYFTPAARLGISEVRVEQTLGQLKKLGMVESNYGWTLTAKGRRYVLTRGWA